MHITCPAMYNQAAYFDHGNLPTITLKKEKKNPLPHSCTPESKDFHLIGHLANS